MKYIIGATLAFGLALSSCSLDLVTENDLTYDTAFKTEQELNATTASIHFFLNSYFGGASPFYLAGAIADESVYPSLRVWSPQTVMNHLVEGWKGLYDAIFESNLLLDNIHLTQDLTPERRNFHMGQAYFALGFSYFALSQRFGEAVITENSSVIKHYALSSKIEVIDASINYAKKALEILPPHDKLTDRTGSLIRYKQFASKGTSAALLAHLYAWKGSVIELYKLDGDAQEAYKQSMAYASMLIDGQVGPYELCATPEELCQRLSSPEEVNPEEIFSLIFDRYHSEYSVSPMPAASYIGWPVNEAQTKGDIVDKTLRIYRKTVTERLYPEPTDLRRVAFFYPVDEADEDPSEPAARYAFLYKWRKAVYNVDKDSSLGKSFRTIDAHYTYWRLADIILLRAENAAKLGLTGEALADLNRIRRRAGLADYAGSGDELKLEIFRERERELFGEHERYFDVLRNGYVRQELQGKFQVLTQQEINDGALVLPIPSTASRTKDGRIINTLIKQHIYWSKYTK